MITPPIYVDAFQAWVYKSYRSSKSEQKYQQIKHWLPRLIFHVHDFVFQWVLGSDFGKAVMKPILNQLMRLNIYLANVMKGHVVKKHQDKFIKLDIAKYWMWQTAR